MLVPATAEDLRAHAKFVNPNEQNAGASTKFFLFSYIILVKFFMFLSFKVVPLKVLPLSKLRFQLWLQ